MYFEEHLWMGFSDLLANGVRVNCTGKSDGCRILYRSDGSQYQLDDTKKSPLLSSQKYMMHIVSHTMTFYLLQSWRIWVSTQLLNCCICMKIASVPLISYNMWQGNEGEPYLDLIGDSLAIIRQHGCVSPTETSLSGVRTNPFSVRRPAPSSGEEGASMLSRKF